MDICVSEKREEASRYTSRELAQGDCNYLRLLACPMISIRGTDHICGNFVVEELPSGAFVISCEGRTRTEAVVT